MAFNLVRGNTEPWAFLSLQALIPPPWFVANKVYSVLVFNYSGQWVTDQVQGDNYYVVYITGCSDVKKLG